MGEIVVDFLVVIVDDIDMMVDHERDYTLLASNST
jgi:hypothetical protein